MSVGGPHRGFRDPADHQPHAPSRHPHYHGSLKPCWDYHEPDHAPSTTGDLEALFEQRWSQYLVPETDGPLDLKVWTKAAVLDIAGTEVARLTAEVEKWREAAMGLVLNDDEA